MIETTKRERIPTLVAEVGPWLAGVVAINGLVFGLSWQDSGKLTHAPMIALPGALVGLAWVVLFGMMATSRWILGYGVGEGLGRARAWVAALMVSCLAWPFYALWSDNALAGFVGNIWTIALAAFVAARVWSHSRLAAMLILPVAAWVAFATIVVFGPSR